MSDVVKIIKDIQDKQLRSATGKAAHPAFRAGDTVRVGVLIKEGEKEREQAFEGVVLCRTNNGARAAFTVRKVSYGVGVERVFPLHSPRVAQIEVIARGKVRRGRLFYLRDLAGKAARIKERHNIAAPIAASTPADTQSQQPA